MASREAVNLKPDGVILRNLKGAIYRMVVRPMEMCVTSVTALDRYVFLATIGYGCLVFK